MSVDSFVRRSLKTAGLVPGLVNRRKVGDLVLLLYHQVGVDKGEISLTVDALERQLRTLSGEDRPMSLDDALADGERGGVVVTFDDGFRDFHENALPLLVRHNIPALLYLATSMVGRPDGVTWGQLQEATSTRLVSVGSHTHGHTDLSHASEAEADGEMRKSKELIEDNLGVPCRHFAFPWAVGSEAALRVADHYFESTALEAWRTNRRGRIDPHRLGRTPILRSDGHAFFRAKVRGMLDSEAAFYRVLGRGPWRFK